MHKSARLPQKDKSMPTEKNNFCSGIFEDGLLEAVGDGLLFHLWKHDAGGYIIL